jgi:hypothetical protein
MASSSSSASGIFEKTPKTSAASGQEGDGQVSPAVPVGRVVASPKRLLGRGTRDTLLNGSDGIK